MPLAAKLHSRMGKRVRTSLARLNFLLLVTEAIFMLQYIVIA